MDHDPSKLKSKCHGIATCWAYQISGFFSKCIIFRRCRNSIWKFPRDMRMVKSRISLDSLHEKRSICERYFMGIEYIVGIIKWWHLWDFLVIEIRYIPALPTLGSNSRFATSFFYFLDIVNDEDGRKAKATSRKWTI